MDEARKTIGKSTGPRRPRRIFNAWDKTILVELVSPGEVRIEDVTGETEVIR